MALLVEGDGVRRLGGDALELGRPALLKTRLSGRGLRRQRGELLAAWETIHMGRGRGLHYTLHHTLTPGACVLVLDALAWRFRVNADRSAAADGERADFRSAPK